MSRKNRHRGMVPSQRTEMRMQAMMRSFSGPLPPPEALERYNLILPGAAERIIAMAETQHDHRQALEKHVVHSNVSAQKLGTVLGFIVTMTVIIGGIWLIHEGKDLAGLTSVLTALAALVGVFVYSKHEQKKELEKKNEALVSAATTR